MAAIGLFYDDYDPNAVAPLPGSNPVSADLVRVLSFRAGPTANDTTFESTFPYMQQPWEGFRGANYSAPALSTGVKSLKIGSETGIIATNYPNPFNGKTVIRYNLNADAIVTIKVIDINGKLIKTLVNNVNQNAGVREINFDAEGLEPGFYFANIKTQYGSTTVKMVVNK